LLWLCLSNTITEYLKPFIATINKVHQITHVCVPDIGGYCITDELKTELKEDYGINITTVPFDSCLFPPNTSNGLYLLIDCMYKHKIMSTVGKIQQQIKAELYNSRKGSTRGSVMWALSFVSNREHKWDGKLSM
jgi:hypothetical protein